MAVQIREPQLVSLSLFARASGRRKKENTVEFIARLYSKRKRKKSSFGTKQGYHPWLLANTERVVATLLNQKTLSHSCRTYRCSQRQSFSGHRVQASRRGLSWLPRRLGQPRVPSPCSRVLLVDGDDLVLLDDRASVLGPNLQTLENLLPGGCGKGPNSATGVSSANLSTRRGLR